MQACIAAAALECQVAATYLVFCGMQVDHQKLELPMRLCSCLLPTGLQKVWTGRAIVLLEYVLEANS